jgi:hypothetical protein
MCYLRSSHATAVTDAKPSAKEDVKAPAQDGEDEP